MSISDFHIDLITLFSQGRYDLGLLNSDENLYNTEQSLPLQSKQSGYNSSLSTAVNQVGARTQSSTHLNY